MASQQLLQFARSRAAPWVAADAVEALARSCSESRVRALVKEGRESGTFTCVGFRKHNEMLFAPLAAASTVACAAPSPAARAPEAAADEEVRRCVRGSASLPCTPTHTHPSSSQPVDTTFACDSLLALCGGEERRHALAAARAKTPCEPPPPGTGAAGLVLRVAGYCSGGGSCEQAALDAGHTVGSVCELDGRSRRALAESPVVLAGGAVLQSDCECTRCEPQRAHRALTRSVPPQCATLRTAAALRAPRP